MGAQRGQAEAEVLAEVEVQMEVEVPAEVEVQTEVEVEVVWGRIWVRRGSRAEQVGNWRGLLKEKFAFCLGWEGWPVVWT